MTITVSDHALVRYVERFHGLNLDNIRNAIVAHVAERAEAGERDIVVDGATFCISRNPHKGLVVATILDAAMRPKKRKNKLETA